MKYKEYLNLCEQYRDKCDLPDFAGRLIAYATKMTYECAPAPEFANDLIANAVNMGFKSAYYEISTEDIEDENFKK